MNTNKVSKRQLAYDSIRARILDGRYGPGQRIIIDRIAKELGSSAIPVREAIHQLESEQLLDYVPNVGAVVRSIDDALYKETLEAVAILEGYATRLAMPHLKPDHLTTLKQLNDEMKTALQHFDLHQFSRLNREFHGTIYAHCPNRLIVKSIEQYRERLNTVRQTSFTLNPKRAPHSILEHDQLVHMLEREDKTADEIELFARQHKLNTVYSMDHSER